MHAEKMLGKSHRKNTKTAAFILLLLSIIIVYNLREKPDDFFNKYISSWESMDFKNMYSMLSEESKKQLSEEQFINRYIKIYNAMGANNIKIKPSYNKFTMISPGRKVDVPFNFSMDTLAGPIEFSYNATLIREKNGLLRRWKLVWNQRMIHPRLDEGDSINVKEIRAKRGQVYDIKGNMLAINGKILTVGLIPGDAGNDLENIKKQLTEELGITGELIDKKLSQTWVKPDSFVPIADIFTGDEAAKKKLSKLKGVALKEKEARIYPYKEAAAHLTGYINSEGEGIAGVEKIYDDKLRARNGYDIFIKDSDGNIKESLAYKEPEDGYNVDLSIDINLQMMLYEELKNEVGSAVAINPRTGQVLAMVSTPSYDPNIFVMDVAKEKREEVINNPLSPLLNRFSLSYVPGSTFKPITAAIGIENGAIDPEKQVKIVGKRWQPDKSWGDYKVTRVSDLNSEIDLNKALVYSDNIYFAQAALKMGKENFLNGTVKFGIGEKVPFDFPVKASQVSKSGIRNDIQLADTSYGQGELLINPLQLALMYTAFLNEGNIIKPFLEVASLDIKPEIWKKNVISKKTAERVLQGLIEAVNYKDAPAKGAKVDGKIIGGKTGTAELKSSTQEKDAREDGWFVGFNADNPELLIVMRIEGVEKRGGSHYVIPKVQRVMKEYFDEEDRNSFLPK